MRADLLTSVLSELNGTSGDIEASGVISTDGLMIASVLPVGMDEDRVGAMSAAMLSLGDRTAQELARGTLKGINKRRQRLCFNDLRGRGIGINPSSKT